jgi:hypothetical protein
MTTNKNDVIPGGESDNMTIEDIAKHHNVDVHDMVAALQKGIKVESEHTSDPQIAEEIAKDHLFEDPKYYDKLEKMEEKKNAKEMPKVFYCKHIQAGVAKYEDEMILIENETLKKMAPSMVGCPVYVGHQKVDLEQITEQADGYIVDNFYNQNDGWFWAKFIAVSDKGHVAIRNGYGVSNAYIPTSSSQSGVWHNVNYDREILDAQYTHLAIVNNPRYEESIILTPEQFKSYNDEKKNQLEEMQNSKGKTIFNIGGKTMKLFKFTKEEMTPEENIHDLSVELTNGKTIKISEMINAVEEEEKKKEEEEKINGETEIEVAGKKMTLNALKSAYENMLNKKQKENEAEEEEKKKAEKEEAEKEEAEKKNAEEAKMKEEEKTNSKYVDEMTNAISKGDGDIKFTYDGLDAQLKRGAERY